MIWVGLIAIIAVIAVAAASLRSDRGDALGIPLVALGSFGFLYVIQPLQLLWSGTLALFLTDWQATKALLVPALMLASFMRGWLRPPKRTLTVGAPWATRSLWWVGFASACVGMILYLVFLERSGGIAASFSQAHGHAMDYTENTAYLYDGPWLMLSGAVMMIFAGRRGGRYWWKRLAPYAFLSLFLLNAILGGDRGPLFAVVSATFICSSIAGRMPVKLKQAAGLLFVLGCAVAIVFANRDRLHFGSQDSKPAQSTAEALNGLVGTSEYDQAHGTVSQEFLYHAAMLDAVDQTGKLEWGQSWIEFFLINPIPRVLWPAKQTPEWHGVNADDMMERTSISIAPGSAPGIVGDLYSRFGLLSALFFYALGLGLRRLFVSASNLSTPLTTIGYVMMYAISLNMFAQGFGAIFVPICYSMAPVVLFTWFARRNRRRVLLRQRRLVLQQFAAVRTEQWSS